MKAIKGNNKLNTNHTASLSDDETFKLTPTRKQNRTMTKKIDFVDLNFNEKKASKPKEEIEVAQEENRIEEDANEGINNELINVN